MSFLSSIVASGAAGLPGAPTGAALTDQRTSANVTSLPASRDAAVTDLSALTSSVNLLAAASSAQSPSDPAAQLTLPPLPQMPATQPPANVPSDDHGTSNVVFSAPAADGDLIH